MKPAKALATAAVRGDLNTMRDMLNEDKALAAHWQPIMDACYIGQADAVALLLDAGADPLMPGSYWLISAIALCATGDSTEFLPALLKKTHRSARHLPRRRPRRRRARRHVLLEADPSLARVHHEGSRLWTNADGWTSAELLCTVHACRERRARKKRKGFGTDCEVPAGLRRRHGTGCVDQAIYSNNMEVLEMLLEAGGTCTDDDTINHAACDGQFDALEMLLAVRR